MITVWCLGGLGNQMFQYAFYRALQLQGYSVCLDMSEFKKYSLHNGYELERLFNLKPNYSIDNSFISSMIRRVIRRFNLKIFNYNFIAEANYALQKLDINQSAYLQGYWQSEKYFIEYRDIIIKDFSFPPVVSSQLINVINNIKSVNSVSIHVRRGDYVNHPLHGGICNLEYYRNAIAVMTNKVRNVHFYVFSNDIDWCKDNLNFDNNVTYIDFNTGENSYRDMQLMSLCKHNIIANSSFSWWGAYLNLNPEKIVIAPSKWFNDIRYDDRDIIPQSWIKI